MKILLTANTSFALANFRAGLIKALKTEGHEIVALVPFDAYTQTLRDAGCDVIDLPMDRRGTSPYHEAVTFLAVARALLRQRPDAVISYTIKNNLYSGFASRWLNIPFVPNVTGLGTVFSEKSILASLVKRAYRFAFGAAKVVFFQNENDRARFTGEAVLSPERAKLLPGSGVDLNRFSVSPLPGRQRAVTFLFVARLLWEKGIGEYVEAARFIRDRYPEARFNILGALERPDRSAVSEEQLHMWSDEDVVTYLGTARDVRPSIRAADCIVLPSYYREGTPRVLLEAAACGRPIVTTDEPGCRDTVEDGKTGFLVSSRNAQDLAEKLVQFIELTPEDRTQLGHAGRIRMEKFYDEQFVVDAYRHVLNTLPQARNRQN